MITPQEAVMIVLGVLACFAGYSMFRTMLPLWGFILVGWIAFIYLPVVFSVPRAQQGLYQAIAFISGGLIGAILAIPLYYAVIFLSGAALGGVFGILLGAIIEVGGISSMRQITALTNMAFPPIPETATQFLLMVAIGLILGFASIGFQKFMIIASSSFVGAAALVSGLAGAITNISLSDMNRAAFLLTGWILMGLLGMFVQFRVLGET